MDFIQAMPDDVLLHILREALRYSYDIDTYDLQDDSLFWPPQNYHPATVVSLSHVSRRFYRLVTSEASFWISVHDNLRSRKLLEVCLSRSRSMGLFIHINFYALSGGLPLEEFLEVIVPHQARWKALTIDLNGFVDVDRYRVLRSRLESMRLSNLERIMIKYTIDDVYNSLDGSDIRRGPQVDILSNAHLPQLCTASFVNCTPRPFTSTMITTLDIEFGSFVRGFRGWDFAALIVFLKHTTSVTSLAVAFACDGPDLLPSERNTHVPSDVVIAQVTHLQLKMHDVPSPTAEKFMQAVKFPRLQSLTIKAKVLEDYESDDEDEQYRYLDLQAFLGTILSLAQSHFPDLSTLVITCRTRRVYTIPFNCLPNLRHLQINGATAPRFQIGPSTQSLRPFPALEVLELTDCDEVSVGWVKQVVEHIQANNTWDRFRTLIISRQSVEMDKFDFIPQQKLTWYPYVPIRHFKRRITGYLIFPLNQSCDPCCPQLRRTSFSVLMDPNELTRITNRLMELCLRTKIEQIVSLQV